MARRSYAAHAARSTVTSLIPRGTYEDRPEAPRLSRPVADEFLSSSAVAAAMRGSQVLGIVAAAEQARDDVVGNWRVARIVERLPAEPARLASRQGIVADSLRCSRVGT